MDHAVMISDPLFRVPEPERELLERCVHASVLRTKSPLTGPQRVALSDKLATTAALALLRQLEPRHKLADANTARRNQPGYDFLIDGRVRVQLKAGTFVESIGWAHSSDPAAADLSFDVLLAVDIGVTLNGRVGRLATKPIATKDTVDYYVVPGAVVRGWIAEGRRVNGRGAHLYMYKYPLKPGSKEERGQTFELSNWLQRFDVLEAATQCCGAEATPSRADWLS